MAMVKCPYCDGEGAEPVMCHTRFPCAYCMGEGELEESKLKELQEKNKVKTNVNTSRRLKF